MNAPSVAWGIQVAPEDTAEVSYTRLAAERLRIRILVEVRSCAAAIPPALAAARTLNSPSNNGQASRYKLALCRRVLLSTVDPPH